MNLLGVVIGCQLAMMAMADLNIRGFSLQGGGGATDTQVNTMTEAFDLANAVTEPGLITIGAKVYNIRDVVERPVDGVVDFGFSGGTYAGTQGLLTAVQTDYVLDVVSQCYVFSPPLLLTRFSSSAARLDLLSFRQAIGVFAFRATTVVTAKLRTHKSQREDSATTLPCSMQREASLAAKPRRATTSVAHRSPSPERHLCANAFAS